MGVTMINFLTECHSFRVQMLFGKLGYVVSFFLPRFLEAGTLPWPLVESSFADPLGCQ